jgi:cyclase
VLTKRLIACFDVRGGRVTKAKQFQDNLDVGDPGQIAAMLYEQGIDEVVYYDIDASVERRPPDLETVMTVARNLYVPFTVGGGVRTLDDMHLVLEHGAEKVSIDSMAVRDPDLITQGAKAFGRQCVVLSLQAKRVPVTDEIPSGYEIFIDGARVATGMDAVEWAKRGAELGAGEICVNSIDRDGTGEGYELDITGQILDAVEVPIIASGGAATAQHLADVFDRGASAGIISSMLYSPRTDQHHTVPELKGELVELGVHVRPA